MGNKKQEIRKLRNKRQEIQGLEHQGRLTGLTFISQFPNFHFPSPMKRLITCSAFLFILALHISAQDAQDTSLIKRPQYFGIFLGRLQFVEASQYLFETNVQPIVGIEQVLRLTVGDAMHAGIFFTYPFLRRMEWDAGFGVFSFKRQKVIAKVTNVSSDASNTILSMQSWIDNKNLVVAELRSHFSIIAAQRENYSILFGAGGWLAANNMQSELNPGNVGVEANITAYYRYHNKSFVQLHLSPGVMRNGYYINATIAVCYQSLKTMRPRPKHYYVRTYDAED